MADLILKSLTNSILRTSRMGTGLSDSLVIKRMQKIPIYLRYFEEKFGFVRPIGKLENICRLSEFSYSNKITLIWISKSMRKNRTYSSI